MIKAQLENALTDMETVARALGVEPFALYLLGGSGCVLAGYLTRAIFKRHVEKFRAECAFNV
ncbi:MAG: hypothetical protein LBR83_03650 [Clostridiales bacterium]|jgi:hypothetical protein|nr:hypothetical protein [Clostridiales bacterium]